MLIQFGAEKEIFYLNARQDLKLKWMQPKITAETDRA